jgi:hypothetical protein
MTSDPRQPELEKLSSVLVLQPELVPQQALVHEK